MGFPSKIETTCLRCNGRVERGETVTWSRLKGQTGVYHISCSRVAEQGSRQTTVKQPSINSTN